MTDTSYILHFEDSQRTVAEFNSADLNSITVGDNTEFDFWLADVGTTLTVTGTYTIDGIEAYESVTIDPGGTLVINGTLITGSLTNNGTLDNNNTLVVKSGITAGTDLINTYREYPGSYSTLNLLNGDEKYRDRIPTAEPASSILIGIEPSGELKDKDVVGVWGVLESVTDNRDNTLNQERYSLTLRVLAPFSEYANHAAAETNLKA